MNEFELQLEGLVGPTHNYAGLSHGNVASANSALSISSPKIAALQSLEKMKFLDDMRVPVAVMPPHPRPYLEFLSRLGYTGSTEVLLQQTHADSPKLLAAIWSASNMWTANAATVTIAESGSDSVVHFTPANLISTLHRSMEARQTTDYLRQIFPDAKHFNVHEALFATSRLNDEGAANHMRLCPDDHSANDFNVFVYGSAPPDAAHPALFPARQQKLACETIARNHKLHQDCVLLLQQHPDAIDAGVFHNDVIAMSHANFLAYHEQAFWDDSQLKVLPETIIQRIIRSDELSLHDAVATYFFNAQIVTTGPDQMAILFPQEVANHAKAKALAETILAEKNPVTAIHFLDLRESMKNGGGPACLRLRVPMTDASIAAMHQGVRFTPRLYQRLKGLIESRYRDHVSPEDLLDPRFAEESLATHQDLIAILGLK